MNATKTKTDAAKIQAIADRHADEGWSFYAAYSGRCMFGRTCPGIVCPPQDARRATAAVRRAGIRSEVSRDSMGLDTIVYWSFLPSDPATVSADE